MAALALHCQRQHQKQVPRQEDKKKLGWFRQAWEELQRCCYRQKRWHYWQ